jgi:glutamate:GABA antiporter
MTADIGGSNSISLVEQPKTFRLFDMVLFSVSAILVADTVASSAAIGVQGLSFWVLLAVVFFIPYGFITAELGSAWPDEGGIYVWIREAFGPMMGTISAWLYWINVAYWAPSVFVLFAGTLATVFWPGMNKWWEAIIVIALIWVVVGIGILPIQWSKWVPNVNAVCKMIVLLGLGVMGAAYAVGHGLANPFGGADWKPSWGNNYAFLPIIIYSFMGFELMNSAGGAIRHPKRDVPKMVVLAGALIVGVYMFATFGILAALKLEDVSIVTGVADALKVSFDNVLQGWGWLYDLAIVILLFTFVGTFVTWSIGANHSMSVTGLDKTAPRVFGHFNRRFHTPDYAFVLMGMIATAVTILNYALFSTKEEVFWTIFALSSIVFLIPYLFMFGALLVLRRTQPNIHRPYVVPGGRVGAWVAVILCELGVLFTIILFFQQVPEGTPRGLFWSITVGGTLVSIVVGWWLYWHSTRSTETAH